MQKKIDFEDDANVLILSQIEFISLMAFVVVPYNFFCLCVIHMN